MSTEIKEYNKLIAEFIGWKYVEDGQSLCKNNEVIWLSNTKYHSSWDWLMPVVEKINKLFNPLTKPMFVTTAGTFLNKIYNAITDVDIQKAYEELVDAIKWYNKNNSQ